MSPSKLSNFAPLTLMCIVTIAFCCILSQCAISRNLSFYNFNGKSHTIHADLLHGNYACPVASSRSLSIFLITLSLSIISFWFLALAFSIYFSFTFSFPLRLFHPPFFSLLCMLLEIFPFMEETLYFSRNTAVSLCSLDTIGRKTFTWPP